jgi:hypothetical protein
MKVEEAIEIVLRLARDAHHDHYNPNRPEIKAEKEAMDTIEDFFVNVVFK